MADQDGDRLSQSIRSQLAAVRSTIRLYVALDGLLLSAVLCMLVFWIAGAIDYLPVTVGSNETPQWLRAAILIFSVMALGWIAIWRSGRRLVAKLPDSSLALLLERRYPQLNNELVTSVELVGAKDHTATNVIAYGAMLNRVHQAVSSRVGGLPTKPLLNWRPIVRYAIAAGFLLVTFFVAAVCIPEWMTMWSKRLFALSNESWPRRSRLQAEGLQLQLPAFTGQTTADRTLVLFENGVGRVPRGASPVLQILADTSAQEVPTVCTLFYRDSSGSRGRANLRRVGGARAGWQQFSLEGPPLDGLTSDLRCDVIGNDARLSNLMIQAIEPAVVNSLSLECKYPNYLQDELSSRATAELLPYRNGLVIPEGTEVVAKGISSSPLSQVQFVVHGAGVPNSVEPSQPDLTVRWIPVRGTQFAIPLGVLRGGLVLEIRLLDQYGLASAQVARYVVNVASDEVPEVQTRLVGIGTAITPRAKLPIKGKVQDDHGLQRIWADLAKGEDVPWSVDLSILPDNQLETSLDLQELAETKGFNLEPDATLGLIVSAQDRFDLDNQKHIGAGPAQQLAVVTDDKLLVILDRLELELRQRFELIIAELTQLRIVLQDIAKIDLSTSGTPSAEEQADSGDDANSAADQARRLAVLRAQQSVLQADKSQQELVGVATRVEDIRMQLVNNRLDSLDRQKRLQERVHAPLKSALENEVEKLRLRLSELQSAALSANDKLDANPAIEALDKLLVVLEQIKANMLDIESYNEIIDLVRGLLESEERLLEETQQQQKKQLLDLFSPTPSKP